MKRWLRRFLIALVILALGGWLVGTVMMHKWSAKPPPFPADVSIMQQKPQARDGRMWLGQSWVGTREGLLVAR